MIFYHSNRDLLLVGICLQYMQNETVQDIWFLLFISAIKTHLRLVGDVPSLDNKKSRPFADSILYLFPSNNLSVSHHKSELPWRWVYHGCHGLISLPYIISFQAEVMNLMQMSR